MSTYYVIKASQIFRYAMPNEDGKANNANFLSDLFNYLNDLDKLNLKNQLIDLVDLKTKFLIEANEEGLFEAMSGIPISFYPDREQGDGVYFYDGSIHSIKNLSPYNHPNPVKHFYSEIDNKKIQSIVKFFKLFYRTGQDAKNYYDGMQKKM